MGRGRAKAKQTKVARELKYRNYNTDFTELQRELHGDGDGQVRPADDTQPDGEDSADEHDDLYDDESESAAQR